MIEKLKIAAYAILVALAIWFGRGFYAHYSQIGQPATGPATNSAPGQTNPVVPTPAPAMATNQSTNDQAGGDGAAGGLAGPAMATNQSTNDQAATNATAASTNLTEQPVAPAVPPDNAPASPSPTADAVRGSRSVGYLAAFVGALIGLGLLLTYDLTHFMGSRAVDYVFTDEGEEMHDPEYEHAEQTWVDGKPLEAIEMMREYLKKHPREQFVALRIAEIYEKDLKNDVAASMEYEEVLRKKLPDERWGWAAIHLCNIYSRLGKQDPRRALLECIARDYPKTGAAKKARHNLGLPEPEEEAAAAPAPEKPAGPQDYGHGQVFDLDEMIAAADEETPAPPPAGAPPPLPPPPPKSNLPPGFRKKE